MLMSEIAERIEKAFPRSLAYEWDNVGLLVGSSLREIKKVLLTLDVTGGVLAEAKSVGADLILSHHPILFSPVKRITDETSEGVLLMDAIKSDLCIYAAHTNCDVAEGGINAHLAELFSIENAQPIEESGLGRIGNLQKPCTLLELSERCKNILGTQNVRVCGDLNRDIKCMAIGSGACSDLIPAAYQMGADVMLTADMKYHEMLNAEDLGICVIDAGHYPTEICVTDIFENLLKGTDLILIKSAARDVFKFI